MNKLLAALIEEVRLQVVKAPSRGARMRRPACRAFLLRASRRLSLEGCAERRNLVPEAM
jgi:hypothetical protein